MSTEAVNTVWILRQVSETARKQFLQFENQCSKQEIAKLWRMPRSQDFSSTIFYLIKNNNFLLKYPFVRL